MATYQGLPEEFNSDLKIKVFYRELNVVLRQRDMANLPNIEVYWSPKMRSALGACYYTSFEGRITPTKICMNVRQFRGQDAVRVRATLIHEAAHAWTMHNCNRADHSAAWKHVAKILGDTGAVYFNQSCVEEESVAFECRDSVPTKIDKLDNRQVHSLRTSLKLIDRKYGCGFTRDSFEKYIRPRFPQFSNMALDYAASVLF